VEAQTQAHAVHQFRSHCHLTTLSVPLNIARAVHLDGRHKSEVITFVAPYIERTAVKHSYVLRQFNTSQNLQLVTPAFHERGVAMPSAPIRGHDSNYKTEFAPGRRLTEHLVDGSDLHHRIRTDDEKKQVL
jgi:hypothetical protein